MNACLKYLIVAFLLSTATSASHAASDETSGAGQEYRITVQFTRLGEVIATPTMDVVTGQAVSGTYAVEGQHQYKIIVLVNPLTATDVYVSLQFVSGSINIQEDLTVTPGTPLEAVIDDVALILLLEKLPAAPAKQPELESTKQVTLVEPPQADRH